MAPWISLALPPRRSSLSLSAYKIFFLFSPLEVSLEAAFALSPSGPPLPVNLHLYRILPYPFLLFPLLPSDGPSRALSLPPPPRSLIPGPILLVSPFAHRRSLSLLLRASLARTHNKESYDFMADGRQHRAFIGPTIGRLMARRIQIRRVRAGRHTTSSFYHIVPSTRPAAEVPTALSRPPNAQRRFRCRNASIRRRARRKNDRRREREPRRWLVPRDPAPRIRSAPSFFGVSMFRW